ncbi:hypothetical protein EVAR_6287_1 [Eumeta japonica]|uniref:Uncharacterized protein n=1 Tax=Eumeta variegata TaxID=151549 RepID=A0A4C1TAY5_EUMVA|nr:hypothetical protein EVAR_6287_1 [Eumeta japonica]
MREARLVPLTGGCGSAKRRPSPPAPAAPAHSSSTILKVHKSKISVGNTRQILEFIETIQRGTDVLSPISCRRRRKDFASAKENTPSAALYDIREEDRVL